MATGVNDRGPFVDDPGALLIYEADAAEALQAILDQDPCSRNPGCLVHHDP